MKRLIFLWQAALAFALLSNHSASAQQSANLSNPGELQQSKQPDRTIMPFDLIVIEVFGEKDLSVERRVQSDGRISYFLLETDLLISGKTPAEVADLLREKLAKDYLVDPQVSVTVKEYVTQTVNVHGAVNKSGGYPLPVDQRWSILDAISQAGGFAPTAHKGKIELTRQGKTRKLNYDDLKRVTDPEKAIWLMPGDLIYVHDSFF